MVKLKEERNKVNKIKVEYEKSLSKLNNDIYQFNQKKEEFEKERNAEDDSKQKKKKKKKDKKEKKDKKNKKDKKTKKDKSSDL